MAAIQRFPRLPSLVRLALVTTKGFELSNIIKPDDALRFHCKICHLLAREPLEIKQCGHIFCTDCLIDYSNKQSRRTSGKFKCPLNDGVETTDNDSQRLEDSSKCAYGLYAEIDLKCANACGAVVSAGTMNHHEGWECPKRVVECAHLGCNVRLPHNEIGAHIDVCEHRLIFCSLCRLPRKFIGRHTCDTEMRKTMDRMLK